MNSESPETLLKEQVQAIIQKARRSLAAARRDIEEGDYDFASSRAYYAAFYAMEAALLTRNLTFSKHSGVIGAFSQHFLQPRIFPREFSKLITRLFRERQLGDYEFGLSIDKEEAGEDFRVADRMLQAITAYFVTQGLIEPLDTSLPTSD